MLLSNKPNEKHKKTNSVYGDSISIVTALARKQYKEYMENRIIIRQNNNPDSTNVLQRSPPLNCLGKVTP